MRVGSFVGGVVLTALLGGCTGGGGGEADVKTPTPAEVTAAPEALPLPPADQVLPTLLVVQAQFTKANGRTVPGAAKLVLYKTDGEQWYQDEIEDPDSNVFHKAIAWRDGILTIGAEHARLVHWTRSGDAWAPNVLWQREWGGKFDRLRDLEIGDVTSDGKPDIVLATHDQGVLAVGEEGPSMWAFHEIDQRPDTFVHEIELGDLDGDGRTEAYATPSGRNRASGESQPGEVVRLKYIPSTDPHCLTCGAFQRDRIAAWDTSHAKEILVDDVDGDGKEELYAVREAHTKKDGDTLTVVEPVKIIRLVPSGQDGVPWTEQVVATLDDRQCRFLIAADVDGDGQKELVAAAYKTGLWVLEPQKDGTFTNTLVDKDSSGFEHATHVADLDGDGKVEIYVAADEQRALRRYTWNGKAFDRTDIATLPENHITWNIQDARL